MKWVWLMAALGLAACGGDDEEGAACGCVVRPDAGADSGVAAPLDAALAILVDSAAPLDATVPAPVDSAVPFAADCAVILSLDSEGQSTRIVSSALDAGTTPISLWAENRTGVVQTLAVDRCLGGPTFEGLGTYDPLGRCLQGACAADLPPLLISVAAGARVSLGERQLELRATACNLNPLARGDYDLSFALNAPQTSAVCGPRPLKLQVR